MPDVATTTGAWRTARGALVLDRPLVAGVLNLTPDSFWDGGLHDAVDDAVRQVDALVAAGADLIDIGAESTRPGARAVPADDELGRLLPVLRALARRGVDTPLSVDTNKAVVARAALDEGAAIINDVSALRLDPVLAGPVAERGAGLVLMHSRGGVDRMASYELAEYGDDVADTIAAELGAALEAALRAGVPEDCIVLDPGLGFSKRTEHSVAALAGLDRLLALGRPVLIGPSRKRFLGDLSGGLPAEERLDGTIAACVAGLFLGARIFRVHDVRNIRRALDTAEAIRRARPSRP